MWKPDLSKYSGPKYIALADALCEDIRKNRLKPVPMDDHGMIPDDLEETLKRNRCRALYMIPHFHNPTTSVMPLERREAIAEIAEKYKLYILEDDVFGCLLQNPIRPVSSMIPHLAFYITSFSKGIAPGLRVGYVVSPERYHQRVLTGLRVTSWMASPVMVEMVSGWKCPPPGFTAGRQKCPEGLRPQDLSEWGCREVPCPLSPCVAEITLIHSGE